MGGVSQTQTVTFLLIYTKLTIVIISVYACHSNLAPNRNVFTILLSSYFDTKIMLN